jgi:hypothetical protein
VNRQERAQFIDDELKGLWPQWNATDAEMRVWMAELATLEYSSAREAIQACFRELTVSTHRPMLGRFLEKVRALARLASGGSRRESRDPTTDVFLECAEPPKDKPQMRNARKGVYVRPPSRQSDPDYVLACADSMRKQFDSLYGGRWIVVRAGLHSDVRSNSP